MLKHPLFIALLVFFCLMSYSFAALLSEDGHNQAHRYDLKSDDSDTNKNAVGSDNSGILVAQAGISGTEENNYLYTGEQHDADTGLYYLRARHYSPDTGRFLTPDSWQGDMTDPATLNRYVYADANPVNRTDPGGHFSLGEVSTANTIRNILTDIQLNTGMSLVDAHDSAQNDPTGEKYVQEQTNTLIFSAMTGIAPRIFKLIDRPNKRRLLKALGCFAEGTPVHTTHGLILIEEIEPDDYVLARNEKSGEFEWCRVVRTFTKHQQQLIEIQFEDDYGMVEKIQCTAEHPFGLKDYGWVAAKYLLPGDEIFTSAGGWLKVSSGTWLSNKQTVYNFEVEGLHNYFVGKTGLWVHNSSKLSINPQELVRTHSISGKSSSKKVKEMVKEMRNTGWNGPPVDVVVHNGRTYIIDGHHRIAAAKMAGLDDVPIKIIGDLKSHPSSYNSIQDVLESADTVGFDRLRIYGR